MASREYGAGRRDKSPHRPYLTPSERRARMREHQKPPKSFRPVGSHTNSVELLKQYRSYNRKPRRGSRKEPETLQLRRKPKQGGPGGTVVPDEDINKDDHVREGTLSVSSDEYAATSDDDDDETERGRRKTRSLDKERRGSRRTDRRPSPPSGSPPSHRRVEENDRNVYGEGEERRRSRSYSVQWGRLSRESTKRHDRDRFSPKEVKRGRWRRSRERDRNDERRRAQERKRDRSSNLYDSAEDNSPRSHTEAERPLRRREREYGGSDARRRRRARERQRDDRYGNRYDSLSPASSLPASGMTTPISFRHPSSGLQSPRLRRSFDVPPQASYHDERDRGENDKSSSGYRSTSPSSNPDRHRPAGIPRRRRVRNPETPRLTQRNRYRRRENPRRGNRPWKPSRDIYEDKREFRSSLARNRWAPYRGRTDRNGIKQYDIPLVLNRDKHGHIVSRDSVDLRVETLQGPKRFRIRTSFADEHDRRTTSSRRRSRRKPASLRSASNSGYRGLRGPRGSRGRAGLQRGSVLSEIRARLLEGDSKGVLRTVLDRL